MNWDVKVIRISQCVEGSNVWRKLSQKNIEYLEIANGVVALENQVLRENN